MTDRHIVDANDYEVESIQPEYAFEDANIMKAEKETGATLVMEDEHHLTSQRGVCFDRSSSLVPDYEMRSFSGAPNAARAKFFLGELQRIHGRSRSSWCGGSRRLQFR